jgi:hypothetical protein
MADMVKVNVPAVDADGKAVNAWTVNDKVYFPGAVQVPEKEAQALKQAIKGEGGEEGQPAGMPIVGSDPVVSANATIGEPADDEEGTDEPASTPSAPKGNSKGGGK